MRMKQTRKRYQNLFEEEKNKKQKEGLRKTSKDVSMDVIAIKIFLKMKIKG